MSYCNSNHEKWYDINCMFCVALRTKSTVIGGRHGDI